MPPTILVPRELAEAIDAKYDDVLSWTRRGLFPAIKSSGRYYYRLDKVLKAIRANQRAEAEASTTEGVLA